jgi:glycosyltransferase involved in cell wall biosynthesis
MHVTYLHQYFNTLGTIGGTRSYEMARRLVAAGHQVTLFTTTAGLGPSWAPSRGWHQHEVAGIDLEVLHVPYANYMSFTQRIRAFFQFAVYASWHTRKGTPDVIFATSTPLTIAIPALAAKLWHRVPLVFEVRDLWPEIPIAVGALKNPLAKAAARALEWIAYHGATHIVALSPGMAEGVMRRGIPNERVTVIPNCCDIDLFDVPESHGERFRAQLGLTPGQPLIVYTGTFGFVNGLGYLVDAAAAMRTIDPDICFLLVGDGKKRDDVIARAKEVGVLDKNLWVWDPVPKNEVPAILAAATVTTSTVIPLEALYNNSANKFFDSLAAGKPIAINYGGWQADLLKETGAGVVLPPDDPSEGARQLAAFVQNSARLQAARTAARHLARTRFARDEMARQLEAVLRKVVAE